MSNAARPLFPVASVSTKSADDNVKALGTVCHVVEVKACWALVHASPMGVAKIASELGLEVFPSKRAGEYYAVRVARVAVVPTPAPSEVRPTPVARVAPAAPANDNQAVRMVLKGSTYLVRETATKRRQDVRRWEVSKPDSDDKAYIVTFQSSDGREMACSCKGGIFHKKCKHMDGIREAFGA